ADPSNPAALEALKRLYYSERRFRDLVAVFEREAELLSDPGARSMALYRAGRLCIDRLKNLDEGLQLMVRAEQQAPSDRLILEEPARPYQRAKRHPEQAAVLERLVALTSSPSQRTGLCHRIGQLYEERLDNDEAALGWYKKELEDHPGYLPALQALAKIYTRRKEWGPLIAIHLAEADAIEDAARRAAAFARVAEIYEQELGQVEQAIAHHVRALGHLPGYAPAFKSLVRLYSQGGRFRDLVELYERAVDEAADPEAKTTYLFKIGRLQEDALGSPGQALSAYRRILEIAPDHTGAIHALQRSAERAGRYKELCAALE